MLLFSLLAAYVVVRLAEDLPAGIHGKTTPRHEYRMAKLKQAEKNGGKPMRRSAFGRYCSGVVDDAWESAIKRRQRMADRRDERQQRRIDRKLRRAHSRDERSDERFERRREHSDERHASRRRRRDEREQSRRPALTTAPEPQRESAAADETEGDDTTTQHTGDGQEAAATEKPQHATNEGVPAVTIPTGETTGLDSAIGFAEQMKSYLSSAVTSTEQSLANLSAGGVTGESLSSLTSAQEQLTAAVQAFEAAENELRGHLTVREAYDATPDAGSKEFVTAG